MNTKQCSKCQAVKSISDFRPDVRYTGGYRKWCKACESDYGKQRRARAVLLPSVPETKWCRVCQQVKPGSAFGRTKDTNDGMRPWCKDCNRDYQREWARKQRLSPEFRERQRNTSRMYMRRRRASSVDEAKKINRLSIERHRRLQQDPVWWQAHQRQRQAYYQRVKVTPAYRIQARLAMARRRAWKLQATTEPITREQWQSILVFYNHQCVYCGRQDCLLEQDHVLPLSRGGAHSIDNLVPACRSCNGRKNARTPEEAGMAIEKKYGLVRRQER